MWEDELIYILAVKVALFVISVVALISAKGRGLLHIGLTLNGILPKLEMVNHSVGGDAC